jgi:hypothetical protein
MKKLNLVFLLLVFTFCAYTVRSQCCCSKVRFSLVDKRGNKLDQSKVKITNITESDSANKEQIVFFIADEPNKGDGNELLSIIYKGSEMKINFKFLGDFGFPYGKITFKKGDFIAEPEGKDDVNRAVGIRIRKAKEELK